MRLLIFIFLLNCTQVLGQYNPFDKLAIIDREDTFEIKYERYVDLKKRVDTLPLFTNGDDMNAWRKIQLVTYYFDSLSVKMISFRDGEREDYFFFFDGRNLCKARIGYKEIGKPNTSYYFSIDDNRNPQAEMNVSFENGLPRKDKFSLLAAGLALKSRFNDLR